MESLHPLLQRLVDANIEFVIVGGFAAVLHGSTFMTRDIDVCVNLSADNIEAIRQSLKDLNPVHRISSPRISFLDSPKSGERLNNLYLQTDLGALDFLSSIVGVGDIDTLKKNAVEYELYGAKVFVISIKDLITCKQKLGRGKDLLVVKELKVLLEKQKK